MRKISKLLMGVGVLVMAASPARAAVTDAVNTADHSGFGAMFASHAPAALNDPAQGTPMLDAGNMDKAAAEAAEIDPAAGTTATPVPAASHR